MRKDPNFYGDASRTGVLNGPLEVIGPDHPKFAKLKEEIEARYGWKKKNQENPTKSQNN